MERLLLKATVTAADQGMFEAVISTATIDRELDIVEPQAMVDALHKWVEVGKKVPLRWNHGTKPEHVIGNIDPGSARVHDGEVVVDGFVDQEADLGKDAWRLVKSGVLGFSFGYMITAGTNRKGGGRHITGLDVYEVTATHAPMNSDTRVLGWKAETEEAEELREESERLEREVAETQIPDLPDEEPGEPEPDLVKELLEVKARLETTEQALADLQKKAEEADKELIARSVDPLRKRSEELALEVASDGMSLRKATPQAPQDTPEPVDLDALRRESRDLMFDVLSYHHGVSNE